MIKHLRMAAGMAAFACGMAQAQVTLAITPSSQVQPWGLRPVLGAVLTGDCAAVQARAGTSLVLRDDLGNTVRTTTVPAVSCTAGSTVTVTVPLDTSGFEFGPLTTRLFTAVNGPLVSPPATISATPDLYLQFRGDTVLFASGKMGPYSVCNQRTGQQLDREASFYPPLPPNIRTPFEITSVYLSDCSANAGTTFGFAGQFVTSAVIGLPTVIPPNAVLYVRDGRANGWTPVPQGCVGSMLVACPAVVSLETRQSVGDMWFHLIGSGTAIPAAAAIAFPQRDARNDELQDLWWGGITENGWGLNIAKSGQNLFATLFVYRGDGTPFWVVLPSGQWDPVHNVWYGDAYIPTSAPFSAYDAKKFAVGSPVGTISLSFDGVDGGHVDYAIGGQQGGKRIERFVFGSREQYYGPVYGGIWWGGPAQDGWGLQIQQQSEKLFATWYTYDANGQVTWFYAPALAAASNGTTYTGTLYRTTGPSWVGQRAYDGSRTQVTAVGTMEIAFAGTSNATFKAVVNGVTVTQAITRFAF